MKKLIKNIIVLLFLIVVSCDKLDISPDQANSFVKLFGSWRTDIGTDVKTFHGGYIVLATITNEDENTDIAILHLDKNGNKKTETDTIDGGGNDIASKLLLTEDGGFFAIGTYTDTLNNNEDIYLAKYNSSGEIDWEEFIGETDSNEQGVAIKKAPSGYIIIANTDRFDSVTQNPAGTQDIYIVKIDEQGNVEWDRNFGGDRTDYASDIIMYYDGYLIVGSSESFNEYGLDLFDVFLVKTNFNGIETHTFTYGGIRNDYGNAVVEAEDGFVFVGSKESVSSNAKMYIAKVDKNDLLDVKWEYEFGENLYDQGFDIIRTLQGYTIVGSTEISLGTTGAMFVKTDTAGVELVNMVIGDFNQCVQSIEQTPDGGYIMVGKSGQEGNEMIFLAKVNSEGEL